MSELSDQLRAYTTWVEHERAPVDAAMLRAQSSEANGLDDEPLPVPEEDRAQGRGPRLLVAAVVIVIAVLAGTVLVVTRSSQVTTGPSSDPSGTLPAPTSTQLPPVGDDPLVSCEPFRDQWFRRSAWNGPTGAENDPDPAAQALRRSVDLAALGNLVAGGPLVPGLPTSQWRRLAVSDDRVLFGAGDLVGDMPLLSFNDVRRVGDTWESHGSGGGGCAQMFVKPPDGGYVAHWTPEQSKPTGRDATELSIVVLPNGPPCGEQLDAEDLLGPDVIETPSSITIRVASTRRPPDASECVQPSPGDPRGLGQTVWLRQPLGDRTVLDGNVFPARPVDLTPRTPTSTPEPPRISLPGGTIDALVDVQISAGPKCDMTRPSACGIVQRQAHLTVRNGDVTVEGDTSSVGTAALSVPVGTTTIAARADGVWCGQVVVTERDPQTAIGCTRLDEPHATVKGRARRPYGGTPVLVTFRRFGGPFPALQAIAAADGSYEVILPAGDWTAEAVTPVSTSNCPGHPPTRITVTDGVEQQIDVSCDA